MYTIAAAWGYIPDDDDPAAWQADRLLVEPRALTPLIRELGALPGVA